ncbi:hypothetical protein LY76DRAFT_605389 [Colletotrichum caudatum]|nr:hypothetical protein LY76DRAFT_605389 [Colletotrichum caudatum]
MKRRRCFVLAGAALPALCMATCDPFGEAREARKARVKGNVVQTPGSPAKGSRSSRVKTLRPKEGNGYDAFFGQLRSQGQIDDHEPVGGSTIEAEQAGKQPCFEQRPDSKL